MYPNDPTQLPPPQQNFSIDYLDQISGTSRSRPGSPSKVVMIIAGVVGLLSIILFGFLVFGGGPSATDKVQAIYLRLDTLESLVSDNRKSPRSNDLRAINSGLSLQLANTITDMEEVLSGIDIDVKKIDKSRIAKETEFKEAVQEEFDNAELNVQLDNTYTRVISYQLATLRAMMESASGLTNDKSLREFLSSADEQLAPFAEKFSAFTDS